MKKIKARTQQSFSHQLCTLVLTHRAESTEIEMRLKSAHVTTKHLPETKSILKKRTPSVLHTTCQNQAHLPFRKEVVDTEMGHLFEHLVIDYLSQFASEQDIDRTFFGLTEWDWKVDPRGTFHITLSVGNKEQDTLYRAITQSYQVLEEVLSAPSF